MLELGVFAEISQLILRLCDQIEMNGLQSFNEVLLPYAQCVMGLTGLSPIYATSPEYRKMITGLLERYMAVYIRREPS